MSRGPMQWRSQALCSLETPDAPELWTPKRAPVRGVRVHLERMCQRCPVRSACAAWAVQTEAECGMYAGVWVPNQGDAGWGPAMEQLRGISAEAADGPVAAFEESA